MMNTGKQTVVVIGSTGLIGTEVVRHLREGGRSERYGVVGVTRRTTPALDLVDAGAIASFFKSRGDVDHVIVAAGDARFAQFDSLDTSAFEVGLRSKVMGQVNVALAALGTLPRHGSVTLTSGQLSHHPIPGSAAVALANGAVESFVRAISLDLPEGPRINVVSPGWVRETMVSMGLDPSSGTSARDVARLYVDALEGDVRGEVLE